MTSWQPLTKDTIIFNIYMVLFLHLTKQNGNHISIGDWFQRRAELKCLKINEIILDEYGTIDGNASINMAKNIIKWNFYHTFGINF